MAVEHRRRHPPLRTTALDPDLIRLASSSIVSTPFPASRSHAATVLLDVRTTCCSPTEMAERGPSDRVGLASSRHPGMVDRCLAWK